MAKSSLEAIGADTDQWIPYLHKEAELGNPDAMAILSQMYRDGDGIEQDLEKAEHYAEMERNAPPFDLPDYDDTNPRAGKTEEV